MQYIECQKKIHLRFTYFQSNAVQTVDTKMCVGH